MTSKSSFSTPLPSTVTVTGNPTAVSDGEMVELMSFDVAVKVALMTAGCCGNPFRTMVEL